MAPLSRWFISPSNTRSFLVCLFKSHEQEDAMLYIKKDTKQKRNKQIFREMQKHTDRKSKMD